MKYKFKAFMVTFIIIGFVSAQNSDFINWEDTAYDQSGATKNNQEINVMVALHFGSPTAIASYVENHKPTTNQNGLFQIKIGNGSPVAGSYDNLPWGSQSSFIETIINGESLGTKSITKPRNYSQFENSRIKNDKNKVTPNSKATQMNKNVLPLFQIEVGNKTLISGEGIKFTGKEPSYTISAKEISLTAGEGLEVTGNYPNYTIALKKHLIGEHYLDGIIFYVDETGQHGLIAGKYSNEPATWTTFKWERLQKATITYKDFKDLNNVNSAVGAGKYNTMKMIANDNLMLNVVDPGEFFSISFWVREEFPIWYVPSYDELSLLYENKHIIQSLLDLSNEEHILWSSTEGGGIWKGHGDGPEGQDLQNGADFEGYDGVPVVLDEDPSRLVGGVKCIDFYTGKTLSIAKTYNNPYIVIREF